MEDVRAAAKKKTDEDTGAKPKPKESAWTARLKRMVGSDGDLQVHEGGASSEELKAVEPEGKRIGKRKRSRRNARSTQSLKALMSDEWGRDSDD